MVIEKHGGPEVFTAREVPVPVVKPGHVLIRVKATSVNPVDVKLRSSELPFSRPLPVVLHGDVAGIVTAVGPGVTRFKEGDEVYGCAGGVRGTDGGALAEYMLADADLLALKPRRLSFAEAAALPLVAITAWEALVDRLRVKPGQNVLIYGATGGVGHIALQIARWLGARVHATAGDERKLALARELGAHVTINHQTENVASYVARLTGGTGFDAALDTVGGANLDVAFQAVRAGGAVATIAAAGSYDLTLAHVRGLSLHSILMLLPMLTGEGRAHHGHILTTVAQLVDDGFLRPLVDSQRFSLAEIAKAHARLASGQAVGKVVVEV
jgi:NADPH2:quinone reductase